MRRFLVATLVVLLLPVAGAHAAAGTITRYPIPITTTPYGMAGGPGGTIWIIDSGNHVGGVFVGKMTTTGASTVSDWVQLPNSELGYRATLGPDGNMWLLQGSHINKMPVGVTQTGQIAAYPLPASIGGFGSIAAGPDGRIWYGQNKQIGAVSMEGSVQTYPTNALSSIPGVMVGPDNKIWFGEDGTITRMSTTGVIGPTDRFPLPPGNSGLFDLTLGSDGNIWFTQSNPAAVGRLTPAGNFTIFPTPTLNSLPFGIIAGPDNYMWFVERNGDAVGAIPVGATSSDQITEYPVGTANAGLEYIVKGADDRMWFNLFNTNQVGAITTHAQAPVVPPVVPVPPPTDPDPGPGPLAPTTVGVESGCTPNQLILTDVFPAGGKTRLVGVAPASAVGRKVELVSTWDGKKVATATVGANRSFSATAKLPPRGLQTSDRTRFEARLGATRSKALKFARRVYTTALSSKGASVTFSGAVVKPLASPRAKVVIRAASSCKAVAGGTVVAAAKPSASGSFRVTITLPESLVSATDVYLRAETSVRRTRHNPKTFRTFSLVRGIRRG